MQMVMTWIEKAQTLLRCLMPARYKKGRYQRPHIKRFGKLFNGLAIVFSQRPTLLHCE